MRFCPTVLLVLPSASADALSTDIAVTVDVAVTDIRYQPLPTDVELAVTALHPEPSVETVPSSPVSIFTQQRAWLVTAAVCKNPIRAQVPVEPALIKTEHVTCPAAASVIAWNLPDDDDSTVHLSAVCVPSGAICEFAAMVSAELVTPSHAAFSNSSDRSSRFCDPTCASNAVVSKSPFAVKPMSDSALSDERRTRQAKDAVELN